MDVLFLDANVLFSAAYREDAGISRLWALTDVELVTSTYALEEARRNLRDRERLRRLDERMAALRLTSRLPRRELPADVALPSKDRPILLAAIGSGATHLLTGDVRHFGPWFGRAVESVLILPPGRYLAMRSA